MPRSARPNFSDSRPFSAVSRACLKINLNRRSFFTYTPQTNDFGFAHPLYPSLLLDQHTSPPRPPAHLTNQPWLPTKSSGTSSTTNSAPSNSSCQATPAKTKSPPSPPSAATSTTSPASATVSHARWPTPAMPPSARTLRPAACTSTSRPSNVHTCPISGGRRSA